MNPKKPTKLKLLAGNPGKRPIEPEPEFQDADLAPPIWLSDEALPHWQQLVTALHINGMYNAANREVLAIYCDLLAEYASTKDLKLVQQIRLMAREFGFTPSSQASVGVANKPESKNTKDRFFNHG